MFNLKRLLIYIYINLTYSCFISVLRFLGNTTHADYFKLLRVDGDSLLVGARNVVYNVSLHSLEENVDQVKY